MAQRKFSSEFKAKVAIEALKGHKTINELALEFEVHLTQMNRNRLINPIFLRHDQLRYASHNPNNEFMSYNSIAI